MRHRISFASALFEFIEIDVTQIDQHSNALRAILEKRLDGMIVRNVFTRETVNAVVERLEQNINDRQKFPMFADLKDAPYTVGHSIVGTDPDLIDYFRDAALQPNRIASLFAGYQDYESRLVEVLGGLAGGLPVEVPCSPNGTRLTPSTIRVLTEGREIGLHVGNEFARMPQARYLQGQIDMTDQISFFITLSVPDSGGELVVYGVEWADVKFLIPKATSADQNNVWLEGTEVFKVFDRMDCTAFSPGPGDMSIFDGGRYFHRVSRVKGNRPRRTIGGFTGFSADHDRIYYWS